MGYEVLKLKQICPTHWNSTYEMFQRILKVREPLISTLALINFEYEVLSQNDWKVIGFACKALKCFLEVTEEVSAEKNVTVSKLIILSNALIKHLTVMHLQLKKHFQNIADNLLLAESTFLDPRFKKKCFGEKAKHSVTLLCNGVQLTKNKKDVKENDMEINPVN